MMTLRSPCTHSEPDRGIVLDVFYFSFGETDPGPNALDPTFPTMQPDLLWYRSSTSLSVSMFSVYSLWFLFFELHVSAAMMTSL